MKKQFLLAFILCSISATSWSMSEPEQEGENTLEEEFLNAWIHNQPFDTVQQIIVNGASPDVVNQQGETPLYFAVEQGRIDRTQFLLEHGASTNIQTATNETPLHLACTKNNVPMARLLLEHNAHAGIHLADFQGRTSLAIATQQPNSKKMQRLLFTWGAQPYDATTKAQLNTLNTKHMNKIFAYKRIKDTLFQYIPVNTVTNLVVEYYMPVQRTPGYGTALIPLQTKIINNQLRANHKVATIAQHLALQKQRASVALEQKKQNDETKESAEKKPSAKSLDE